MQFIKPGVLKLRGDGNRDTRTASGLVELFTDIASKKNGNLTVVEIGSYSGESSSIMLGTGLVSLIFCVDPWLPGYAKGDWASDRSDFAEVERTFDARHAGDSRVVKVKGTIDTFFTRLSSGDFAGIPGFDSVDVVYIDGCHTYDCVKHDIAVASGSINPKVALCFHDYTNKGVKRAVAETLGEPVRVYSDTSCLFYTDNK